MIVTADKIPGKDTPRSRNYCIIEVSYELLAKLLELPVGSSIVSTEERFDNHSVAIKVIGGIEGQKMDGGEIVKIIPGQGGWVMQ